MISTILPMVMSRSALSRVVLKERSQVLLLRVQLLLKVLLVVRSLQFQQDLLRTKTVPTPYLVRVMQTLLQTLKTLLLRLLPLMLLLWDRMPIRMGIQRLCRLLAIIAIWLQDV